MYIIEILLSANSCRMANRILSNSGHLGSRKCCVPLPWIRRASKMGHGHSGSGRRGETCWEWKCYVIQFWANLPTSFNHRECVIALKDLCLPFVTMGVSWFHRDLLLGDFDFEYPLLMSHFRSEFADLLTHFQSSAYYSVATSVMILFCFIIIIIAVSS